jgi:hypothetical protein
MMRVMRAEMLGSGAGQATAAALITLSTSPRACILAARVKTDSCTEWRSPSTGNKVSVKAAFVAS